MQLSPDYLFPSDFLGQNLWGQVPVFLESLEFNSKLDLHGLGNIIKIKHSINNDENLKADRQTNYMVL